MKFRYRDKIGQKYKKGLGDFEPPYSQENWQRMRKKILEVEASPRADNSNGNIRIVAPLKFQWMRVAAVVLGFIVLSIGVYYITAQYKNDMVLVLTSIGEKTEVVLPDSSVVVLNELSELQYSPKSFSRTREMTLAGEAYFTVTRDENRPFNIYTEEMLVTVLGTSFNIRAYLEEEQDVVIVNDGTVRISPRKNENASPIILKKGESVELIIKNQSIIRRVNSDLNFKAWMTNELVFSNTTLSEIVIQLNKYYRVNIEIIDDSLKNRTLSATFKDDSLEEVLEVLKLVFYIQIENEGEKIFLSKQPVE